MAGLVRAAGSMIALLLLAGFAPAAEQKNIDAAIQKGAEYLKQSFRTGTPAGNNHGVGPAALAGIALIEAKVPANDPTLTAIATAVREAAYGEIQTYQISLCLLFLDKLENPADVPLIQVLAVRLLSSQTPGGGWGYGTLFTVSAEEIQWLKTRLKPAELVAGKDGDPKPANKGPALHPDVQEYANALAARRAERAGPRMDDNSNTQFAILAIWAARKHGVPVEAALDLIEKRFLATQDPQTGCWFYNDTTAIAKDYRITMTSAGLLGLSTGVARRADRKKPEGPKPNPKAGKSDDPFFSPTGRPDEKKTDKGPEMQTPAIQRGFACMSAQFTAITRGGPLGEHPYYTYWSIERVGVLYNVDKIGGIDWYEYLSDVLVKAQGPAGGWNNSTIDTAFALLVLCKANLTRDLSNKFKGKDNELRAGTSGATPSGGNAEPAPMPKGSGTVPGINPLPAPKEDESTKLANQLVLAPATDWNKALEKLRDAKGAENTRGLVIAIGKLDGDRKKEAREALAERLTRMSAETLRGMMTADQSELRRGAVLAAAMKDDKSHVPDLIDRLLDEDDAVVRAAYAGLKSLTPQDFGPAKGAKFEERKAAAAKWKAWWDAQKK